MTEHRKLLLKRKLQESRWRLRNLNSEFAEPLSKMYFVATKDVYRISTNGQCIFFDADWLSKSDKTAVDFILSHQLMHIALGHIYRPTYYNGERFHLACDIVANSRLELLGFKYDKIANIGKIYYETFFPAEKGRTMTAREALDKIPFDPATLTEAKMRKYMIDSDLWWGKKGSPDDKWTVVLKPDDKDPDDLQNEKTTGGQHFFVKAEYVNPEVKEKDKRNLPKRTEESDSDESSGGDKQEIVNMINNLRSIKKHDVSLKSDRNIRISHFSSLDWRKLLNSFVEEFVSDYSFTPPDRRFVDSGFFLPDFNEVSSTPGEVLFWVDTSGSVNDKVLSRVYGEIFSSVMQFDGKLRGNLGFFDTQVTPPVPFCSVEELLHIVPKGGGGTDFNCIFRYMQKNTTENTPSVVIFTDGQADFPKASAARNLSVLWLFSQKNVVAPWGKWAYVE